MATTFARLKLHRQTAAQWTSTNRVLLQSEIGVETDTNAYKIGDGSTAWNSLRYDKRFTFDTASNFSSNNPTVGDDITAYESDTGYYKIGDGVTAYNTLLYVNRVNYVTGTAANYSFSTNGEPMYLIFTRDGTARTITLEDDADHDAQVLTIEVTGSGAGNVSLNTTGAATIEGETATTWEWDGEGKLILQYDHANTNYNVLSTGIWDSGTVADSGNDINRVFRKYTTDYMEQNGENDPGTFNVSTASGGVFRTGSFTVVFGITYSNIYSTNISSDFLDSKWTGTVNLSTSGFSYYQYRGTSVTNETDNFLWYSNGTWR